MRKYEKFMVSKDIFYNVLQMYQGQIVLKVIHGCSVVYTKLKSHVLLELLGFQNNNTDVDDSKNMIYIIRVALSC